MSEGRQLDWEGCFNVRDLGGLETTDGQTTRRGAVVRGDSPDGLTAAGWAALEAYGVRTIIDLRNDDERREAESPLRPAGVETVRLPLDGTDEDPEFWERWGSGPAFGTPLYYGPHLKRFPERNARVLAAVADAPPGGVLFHCVGGCDRTGQIAMLLLALAGVAPEQIAADYCLSPQPLRDEFLAGQGTSATEVVLSTLAELDVEAHVRSAGLTDAAVERIRARLR